MTTRALIIGRFQPLHKGHMEVIRKVSKECDQMIIGIGSAQYSHTRDNPFTAGERYQMILETLRDEKIDNACIVPIEDLNRYSLWVTQVVSMCPPFNVVYSNNRYTRRLFYEAGFEVRESPIYNREEYSGTEVRAKMFRGEDWRSSVPKKVAEIIDEINGVERIQEVTGDSPDGTKTVF